MKCRNLTFFYYATEEYLREFGKINAFLKIFLINYRQVR